MAEQEAEAFAKRLTRVWKPQEQRLTRLDSYTQLQHWGKKTLWSFDPSTERFEYRNHQPSTLYLWVHNIERRQEFTFALRNDPRIGIGSLECRKGREILSSRHPAFIRFAAQWLPLFRRGCWLSGCDIEASAHEKAEWMRGFTQEEVESWNLKI